ncbi:peptidyl-tRNA hydrolase ICT1, mitochondrial [Macrosteles quadrilineatus]|uniref:peptidyl-tRNA hydrolase ICT1, mitochondrial n=1 Tax=Macrosteles quadrilineatus TaxID=74068 RepID=UPI0023E0E11D|nr:peptidyl-tRNA hydrolase ICT1, mitochondrial [Macrosteles quadrilineatus]
MNSNLPRQISLLLSKASRPILRLPTNKTLCYRLESNYQSSISLKQLYPASSLRLSSPNKVPEKPGEKFNGFIPIEALKITYSRSSGPGGQHVNTVNTKVDLRFHLETADWLHPDLRSRMAEKYKTKISKEGFLIIRSDKTRSQQLNLADCMEILRALIREVEYVRAEPSPETQEQIRRRKEKANQVRLIEKRSKSVIKANRREPPL